MAYSVGCVFCIFNFLQSHGRVIGAGFISYRCTLFLPRKLSVKLFLEKIPYLILALILGIVSLKVTKPEDAFTAPVILTLWCNACFLLHIICCNILQSPSFHTVKVGTTNIGCWGNQTLPVQYYIAPIIVLAFLGLIISSFARNPLDCSDGRIFTATTFLILMLYTIGPTIFSERYTYISSLAVYLFIGLGVSIFCIGKWSFSIE